MSDRRILVTGGAGFIGSHLARRLAERGDAITVLDDCSSGARANVPEGLELLELDCGRADLDRALAGRTFDAVCHLAGQSSGEKSFDDPVRDFDANARSTIALAAWAASNDVRTFVHASSMAVYGRAEQLPMREDDPLAPLSFYGASKRAAESVLQLQPSAMRTVSLRMFSVYGPGQDLNELRQGMASIYLSYVLRGEPVEVRGPLNRTRDLVYVDDVVDAWVAALDADSAHGALNVGTGVATSVGDLLQLIFAACGVSADYPVVEAAGTPGDQPVACADTTRVERKLSWHPRVDLPTGLGRLVTWATNTLQPR